MRAIVLAVFLLSVPLSVALAQAPGAVPPLQTPGSEFKGGAEGTVSFARFGEDYFLNVGIGTSFSIGKFAWGLQAPLKIRVIDKAPLDKEWYRKEDWDDPSDWTRILRFFQYGSPKDLFYLRLGELVSASIGHATIVSRYYNTLDLDHYHTGLWTAVNLDKGGVEMMTNDILAWNLFATRGYIRPFTLFLKDPHPIIKTFAFGTTFASDFLAPSRQGSGQVEVEKAAWFIGLDLETEVFRNKNVAITPYTDVNFFADIGVGWHLGILNEFQVAKSQFQLKLEYRLISANHSPNYFNTLYDIERVRFLPLPPLAGAAPGSAVPKLWYFQEATGLKMRHGFYGELFANIMGLVGIGGIYEDYQGPDNASVTLRADLPVIAGFKLAGYYTRRNFDGFSELFSLDNAWLVGELRYHFLGPMYAYGIYARYWEEEKNDEGYTSYKSDHSFQFGVGASFTF